MYGIIKENLDKFNIKICIRNFEEMFLDEKGS